MFLKSTRPMLRKIRPEEHTERKEDLMKLLRKGVHLSIDSWKQYVQMQFHFLNSDILSTFVRSSDIMKPYAAMRLEDDDNCLDGERIMMVIQLAVTAHWFDEEGERKSKIWAAAVVWVDDSKKSNALNHPSNEGKEPESTSPENITHLLPTEALRSLRHDRHIPSEPHKDSDTGSRPNEEEDITDTTYQKVEYIKQRQDKLDTAVETTAKPHELVTHQSESDRKLYEVTSSSSDLDQEQLLKGLTSAAIDERAEIHDHYTGPFSLFESNPALEATFGMETDSHGASSNARDEEIEGPSLLSYEQNNDPRSPDFVFDEWNSSLAYESKQEDQ